MTVPDNGNTTTSHELDVPLLGQPFESTPSQFDAQRLIAVYQRLIAEPLSNLTQDAMDERDRDETLAVLGLEEPWDDEAVRRRLVSECLQAYPDAPVYYASGSVCPPKVYWFHQLIDRALTWMASTGAARRLWLHTTPRRFLELAPAALGEAFQTPASLYIEFSARLEPHVDPARCYISVSDATLAPLHAELIEEWETAAIQVRFYDAALTYFSSHPDCVIRASNGAGCVLLRRKSRPSKRPKRDYLGFQSFYWFRPSMWCFDSWDLVFAVFGALEQPVPRVGSEIRDFERESALINATGVVSGTKMAVWLRAERARLRRNAIEAWRAAAFVRWVSDFSQA